MTPSFNLLDEPWLPVNFADGRSARLGLLELFQRSSEIAALADANPPDLVAQYRLLLAILHRALSRKLPEGWKDKDRVPWYRDGLPVEAITDYLEYWRERFWLFHPEYPFMQVAALASAQETRDKRKPWTQISLASACGSAPVMFDHAVDIEPSAILPVDAICMLLGLLQFKPGGLIQAFKTSDKDCALVNTAATIAIGNDLGQTLALNLLLRDGRVRANDLPAWERPPLAVADLRGAARLATGYNDLYTRQSRAVLFLREDDGSICWLHFGAGFALEKDDNLLDPMASVLASQKDGKPIRLTFSEGRALWRDLPVLLPEGKNSQPAATLESAIQLLRQTAILAGVYQSVLVAGVASVPGKDKLLRWRCEYMQLPLALLEDAEKTRQLRKRISTAEGLYDALRQVGASMLAETLPDPQHKDTRSDTRSAARKLFDASAFPARYFSNAERNLPQLMEQLAVGAFVQAHTLWNEVLRNGAHDAWQQLLTGLGSSPHALIAAAKFQGKFDHAVNRYAPKPEDTCE